MIALDTNVLIYCCDRRDPRRQQLALDLVAGITNGILPWQVACEFIAPSRKLAEQGFTATQAWQRLGEFLALFPMMVLRRPCSSAGGPSTSNSSAPSGTRCS